MRSKGFGLFNTGEEGAVVQFLQRVNEKGKILFPTFSIRSKEDVKYNKKVKIRAADKTWIYHNIPSSIWWHTETHHDWDNGGFLFLVSPEEHRKITQREVKERWKMRKRFIATK